MKFGFLAALLLAAACAPAQSPRPSPVSTNAPSTGSVAAPASSSAATNPKPATSYSQDAVECERKAALASAGSKGEAFAACMRGRGYTPGK